MKSSSNNPWTIGSKFIGVLTEKSEGIVMNNSDDRNSPNKILVNYFITEKIDLLAGHNTVALFKIKKAEPQLSVLDEPKTITNLMASYINKKSAPSKSSTI